MGSGPSLRTISASSLPWTRPPSLSWTTVAASYSPPCPHQPPPTHLTVKFILLNHRSHHVIPYVPLMTVNPSVASACSAHHPPHAPYTALPSNCAGVLSRFSCVQLCATLWTVAPPPPRQAPLSMGILQARILEWVACPPPGDLPDLGIELLSLISPALAGRFCCFFFNHYYHLEAGPPSHTKEYCTPAHPAWMSATPPWSWALQQPPSA